jgi:hypothetical protein
VAPEDARVGMAVEAVWKPAEERAGSILDIAYFKPSEGSGGSRGRRDGAIADPAETGTA